MTFQPPKMPKMPEWASYIPERSPEFKMHKTEGQCKQAFSYYGQHLRLGIVYRWTDGEWQIVHDFSEPTERKDHPWWAETDRKKHVSQHNMLAEYGERLRREERKPSRYGIEGTCACGEVRWKVMGYSEQPCTDSNCLHC